MLVVLGTWFIFWGIGGGGLVFKEDPVRVGISLLISCRFEDDSRFAAWGRTLSYTWVIIINIRVFGLSCRGRGGGATSLTGGCPLKALPFVCIVGLLEHCLVWGLGVCHYYHFPHIPRLCLQRSRVFPVSRKRHVWEGGRAVRSFFGIRCR